MALCLLSQKQNIDHVIAQCIEVRFARFTTMAVINPVFSFDIKMENLTSVQWQNITLFYPWEIISLISVTYKQPSWFITGQFIAMSKSPVQNNIYSNIYSENCCTSFYASGTFRPKYELNQIMSYFIQKSFDSWNLDHANRTILQLNTYSLIFISG